MLTKNLFKKAAAVVLSAAVAGLFGAAGYYSLRLPENVTAESADSVSFAMYPELSCIGSVNGFEDSKQAEKATLSLFGAIPVKSVNVRENEAPTLVVCGEPFGVKLLMEGVMVTGMSRVDCSGEDICPAELAGVEVGDVIRSADGCELTSNADLQRVISESGGRDVLLSISRGGADITADLRPVMSERDEKWRGGMWVRDSIAGIGNDEANRISSPALTTVRLYQSECGREAARQLLRRIGEKSDDRLPSIHTMLGYTFVEGNSI